MTDSATTFRPIPSAKRAAPVRAAIEKASLELAQLEHERRAHFAATGDDTKRMLSGSGEITAKIQATQARVAGLQDQLRAATDADYQEALKSAEGVFGAALAAAVEHLRARAPLAEALDVALAEVGRLLHAIDDCNAAASDHFSRAARDLPRRMSNDLVHAVRQQVTGGQARYGLLGALTAAGVGKTGITAGVILDNSQIPTETVASGLAKDLDRIERQLGRWVQLAKGAGGRDEPITAFAPDDPAPPSKQVKWADQTDIGFGGQAPKRDFTPYA